jgi:hypothetical protein
MIREDLAERIGLVAEGALPEDRPCGRVQEGQEIGDAIAFVDVVDQDGSSFSGWQVWAEAPECLNARALVKAVEMLGRILIESNDRLGFGEEVGIGDLEEVLMPMGTQGVLVEDSLESGMAGAGSQLCRLTL